MEPFFIWAISIAASTHTMPMMALAVGRSPPSVTEKMPANTGSMDMTMAVNAVDNIVCAQVWIKKAAAVASTAVIPTVIQTEPSGGIITPSGMAKIRHITAVVKICITVSVYVSCLDDHSPRAMI